MFVDAYAPCPCGSGKKFKWCCQAFYDRIERASAQNALGQHETALRLMDELTAQFPQSPEVWGRRAELLWENQRLEEAEQSLQKALAINPNYAFGYYLRGMFRHDEGEIPGALLLYRKAAELCDPGARDLLAEIYGSIGQCELLLNRPLAARAAWQIALRYQPSNENLQRTLTEYFSDDSPFPPLARKEYTFKRLTTPQTHERQQVWERALQTGKLSDVATAFEQLTDEAADDAAAWYNLGLVRAWLGDNLGAIEAFDAYVVNEPDEEQAAAAWALTEVLRFGHGMENATDYIEHRVTYRILDLQAVAEAMPKDKRIVGLQQREGGITGTVLNREMPPADENLATFQLPRAAAYLILARDRLRLLNTDASMLDQARQIIEPLFGPAISEPQMEQVPAAFPRLLDDALSIRIPPGLKDEHAERLFRQHLQQAFEEAWLQRPLKALNQVRPIDAAEHPVLRKKLLGVIQFLEDVAQAFLPIPYDFDRLRHKLGLPTVRPATEVPRDIATMNPAELAGLELDQLSDEELKQAFQTALQLDAHELAGQFARAAINRPPAEEIDRYPFYNHLVQLALENDQPEEALAWVDSGLKEDCEHNEGRRRNDYELRRAQVHLQANEPEAAQEVFRRLIQRVPSDLNVLGKAAEAMLSARQPEWAATFAEQGLTQARTKGDRDHAGYFEELLAAARRQD